MGAIDIFNREEFKEYRPLLKEIEKAAKQLVENYEKDFLTISHAADADGLASAGVIKNTIDLIRYFKGYAAPSNTNKVRRIMGFSQNREDKDSLTQIIKGTKEDSFVIISDLGTLISKEFNELSDSGIINNAIIVDHHQPANVEGHYNLNPLAHVKEGLPELSASSISAVILHYVVEELKNGLSEDEAVNKDVRKQLKIIEKMTDYLTLLAIGGDKADMQGPKGLTKALYDHLIQRSVLKKVETPYYGYKTKNLTNVIAESDLPFNLKYRPARIKETRKALDLDGNTELKKEDYEILKGLFVINQEGKIGVNSHYMQNLSKNKIDLINKTVKMLTGSKLIDTSSDTNNFIYQHDFEFNDFRDDIYRHKEKQNIARELLIQNGFNPDDTAEKLSDKKRFVSWFKENLDFFSDYRNKEKFDSILNEQNYCAERGGRHIVKNHSPGEQGFYMTAMSKMGEGEFFLEGVELELSIIKGELDPEDEYYNEIVDILESARRRYKRVIHLCMKKVEEMIEEKKGFEELQKNTYYLNMDPVKEDYLEYNPGFGEDFVKMVGVLGKMTTKARLLPNHYGILFTGTENNGLVKISARVNTAPGQKVNFSKFYKETVRKGICISGGGHKVASAGILKSENFDKFIRFIGEYKFNK